MKNSSIYVRNNLYLEMMLSSVFIYLKWHNYNNSIINIVNRITLAIKCPFCYVFHKQIPTDKKLEMHKYIISGLHFGKQHLFPNPYGAADNGISLSVISSLRFVTIYICATLVQVRLSDELNKVVFD